MKKVVIEKAPKAKKKVVIEGLPEAALGTGLFSQQTPFGREFSKTYQKIEKDLERQQKTPSFRFTGVDLTPISGNPYLQKGMNYLSRGINKIPGIIEYSKTGKISEDNLAPFYSGSMYSPFISEPETINKEVTPYYDKKGKLRYKAEGGYNLPIAQEGDLIEEMSLNRPNLQGDLNQQLSASAKLNVPKLPGQKEREAKRGFRNYAEGLAMASPAIDALAAGYQFGKGALDMMGSQMQNKAAQAREADMYTQAVFSDAMNVTPYETQGYGFSGRNALAADGMQIRQIGGMGEPNVEVEGREHIKLPNGFSQEIQGKSHAQGGIPLNLPQGTQIFSEKLKDPQTKKSYADLAKKFETKKYVDLLNSKSADPIQKTTAEMMIKQNNQKLEELFALQEQNKLSGAHGADVQQKAMQEQQQAMAQEQAPMQEPMMAHGGLHLPRYSEGGNGSNPKKKHTSQELDRIKFILKLRNADLTKREERLLKMANYSDDPGSREWANQELNTTIAKERDDYNKEYDYFIKNGTLSENYDGVIEDPTKLYRDISNVEEFDEIVKKDKLKTVEKDIERLKYVTSSPEFTKRFNKEEQKNIISSLRKKEDEIAQDKYSKAPIAKRSMLTPIEISPVRNSIDFNEYSANLAKSGAKDLTTADPTLTFTIGESAPNFQQAISQPLPQVVAQPGAQPVSVQPISKKATPNTLQPQNKYQFPLTGKAGSYYDTGYNFLDDIELKKAFQQYSERGDNFFPYFAAALEKGNLMLNPIVENWVVKGQGKTKEGTYGDISARDVRNLEKQPGFSFMGEIAAKYGQEHFDPENPKMVRDYEEAVNKAYEEEGLPPYFQNLTDPSKPFSKEQKFGNWHASVAPIIRKSIGAGKTEDSSEGPIQYVVEKLKGEKKEKEEKDKAKDQKITPETITETKYVRPEIGLDMAMGIPLPEVYGRDPLNYYKIEPTYIDPRYLDIQPQLNEITRGQRALQSNIGSRGTADMANLLQAQANAAAAQQQAFGQKYNYDRAQDLAAQQANAQAKAQADQFNQQSWFQQLEDPIRRREGMMDTQRRTDAQQELENMRKMQAFYANKGFIGDTFYPLKNMTGEQLLSTLPPALLKQFNEQQKEKKRKYGGKVKIKPKFRK